MTSIDIRDAEVQQHFTALRKAQLDREKEEEVGEIAKLYDRSDEYSYGVWNFSFRYLHAS